MTGGLVRRPAIESEMERRQEGAGSHIAAGHSFLRSSHNSVASFLKPEACLMR
jgi:hypothetical protein